MYYGLFAAVIFSRIDPGGKFVLGFRRASDSTDTQVVTVFSISLSVVSSFDNAFMMFFLLIKLTNDRY